MGRTRRRSAGNKHERSPLDSLQPVLKHAIRPGISATNVRTRDQEWEVLTMTSEASEVQQIRARSGQALRKAARQTTSIARGVEREFWTGVLIIMRWGKGRLRAFHSAFDQMVTRVEYRAGRSAEKASIQLPRPTAAPTAPGGASNGSESHPDRVSAPAF